MYVKKMNPIDQNHYLWREISPFIDDYDIHYIAIGSAENGEISENNNMVIQQYPKFLSRLHNVNKCIWLIDQFLRTPRTYLEDRLINEGYTEDISINLESINGKIIRFSKDSQHIQIIIIRSNNVWNKSWNSKRSINEIDAHTYDLFTKLIHYIYYQTNSLLFLQCYNGDNHTDLEVIIDTWGMNDRIIIGIAQRAYTSCFIDENCLTDIQIIRKKGNLKVCNPYNIPLYRVYHKLNKYTTNQSFKLQITYMIYRKIYRNLMNAAYFIDFLIRKTQKNDFLDYDQFTCYILDNDDRKTLFSEYMCDNSREKSIHKCIEIFDNYFKHCLALVDINDFIINPNETFVERVKHLKSILPQKINPELLEAMLKTSLD
jgi:hypothetical protein